MPFWVVSRSLSAENPCGTQESTAMLASTRGPSRNPAWAATTSSAASENRVSTRKTEPNGRPATSASTSTAFIVLPGAGSIRNSR